MKENPFGNFEEMYRHISKGAWTFSIQDHGWQVSDCTAEGLKVLVIFRNLYKHQTESMGSWPGG